MFFLKSAFFLFFIAHVNRKDFYVICLLFLSVCLLRPLLESKTCIKANPIEASRIVSLAPSITETLYFLGLWSKVVGVTHFCSFPNDARTKAHVAGFGNVNLEAILKVGADHAILPSDQKECSEELSNVGIPVAFIDTRSLEKYLDDITVLARLLGADATAKSIVNSFNTNIKEAQIRAKGRKKPRVLFAVMHVGGDADILSTIHIVGKDGFFDRLLESAGGINVYSGNLAFPQISREAIIHMNPDVIIDVLPYPEDSEKILNEWMEMKMITAVKSGRVHIFSDQSDTIPGLRSALTLQKLSHCLFP